MFNIVVVGADGSATARRAVEAAAEIALLSGGQLHIVSAFDPKAKADGHLPDEFRHLNTEGSAEAILQELSFITKKLGLTTTLHAVAGDPADAIIDTAVQVEADLVVVGNQGMHGVRRVLGSVPNSVAHRAPCSVAIIDTAE